MEVFLGVDGGGSHTRSCLVNRQGDVLALGRAGSSNRNNVDAEILRRNITGAVEAAMAEAGLAGQACKAAFFGMAGVLDKIGRELIRGIAKVATGMPAEMIVVDHDIRISLAGGLGGSPGVALIAGTGSSCYARDGAGNSCQVGGKGALLDDGGSGYFLGYRALVAIVRAGDGRSEETLLAPGIFKSLGVADLGEMLRLVYGEGLSRAETAALAPVVIAAAAKGDRAARAILEEGAAELVLMVRTAAKRLGLASPYSTVISGGVGTADTLYREVVEQAFERELPDCRLVEPLLPPVGGAVLLALELGGVKPEGALLEHLAAEFRKNAAV